jgi:hypothetical protein
VCNLKRNDLDSLSTGINLSEETELELIGDLRKKIQEESLKLREKLAKFDERGE